MDPLKQFPAVYKEACIIAWKNKFRRQQAIEAAHDHQDANATETCQHQANKETYFYKQIRAHKHAQLLADADAEELQYPNQTESDFKMVQLVEVEDEHFQGTQQGPIEEDADFTDTDSEISDDSDYDPSQETLAERLAALKDIIPPKTRGWISDKVGTGVSIVQSTWYYGSRTVWVVCATALMVGVPLATCWTEDQQIEGMEREYRMREMGGELLTAGDDKEGSTADQLSQSLGKAEARPAL